MRCFSIRGWIGVCLATVLSITINSSVARSATPPRLTVIIVIDQFRPDYLIRFDDLFVDGGFRRLMDGGAWMTDATYGHLHATTSPGHSVITSGTYGYRSGMIDNYWFNRELRRPWPALADSQSHILGKTPTRDDHSSPRVFRGSTLGDELRMSTNFRAKAISTSLKDYSAIVSAGKFGTPYWFEDEIGTFTSSDYYMKELPAWVNAFNARKLPESYFGKQWNRLLPDTAYERTRPDSTVGERNYKHNGVTFPHTVTGENRTTDASFYSAFKHTPWASEVELAFAREVVIKEGLGQDETPDLLIVSLSANDYVGHDFGPFSQEVLDITVRTDRQLAAFLSFLDERVGREHTLIVLTSDHGAVPIPEDMAAQGMDAGRVGPTTYIAEIETALDAKFGEDDWVMGLYRTGLYLDYEAIHRHRLSRAEVERVSAEILLSFPSIAAAYTRTQIMEGTLPDGPVTQRVRRSFHPDYSGDVIPVATPYYIIIDEFSTRNAGTTHGQPYDYDLHVPVIFYGPWIKPGKYRKPVDMADVTPTICEILGITMPTGRDGKVLGEILN